MNKTKLASLLSVLALTACTTPQAPTLGQVGSLNETILNTKQTTNDLVNLINAPLVEVNIPELSRYQGSTVSCYGMPSRKQPSQALFACNPIDDQSKYVSIPGNNELAAFGFYAPEDSFPVGKIDKPLYSIQMQCQSFSVEPSYKIISLNDCSYRWNKISIR